MKIIAKALVLIAAIVMGFAAVAQTVDSTSEETLQKTVGDMVADMSQKERDIFLGGMMNYMVFGRDGKRGEAALHGLTRDEIMAHGRSLVESTAASPQEGQDLRGCLRNKVAINGVDVGMGDFGYRLSLSVTNNLSWAISGIRFSYKVATKGRSVPWLDDTMSLSISGGIEPGETRTVSTTVLLSKEAASPLVTEATILDVADPQKLSLVGDVRVFGWAEGKSSRPCQ